MDQFYHTPGDRFFILIARQLAGTIDANEQAELNKIFLSNPDLRLRADMFYGMWEQENNKSASGEMDEAFMRHLLKFRADFLPEDGHTNFTSQTKQPQVKKSNTFFLHKRKLLLAAGLVFAILISAYFILTQSQHTNQVKEEQISSVITKYGNKTKVSLPDGSQVWLNAGSKLDYNNGSFNQTLREVKLSGEAYFDIAHKDGKPFIVRSGNMRIRVLGTKFNVKAYPEEQNIETSLIKGSVEITIKDRPDDKYILRPNEKLVVSNEGLTQKFETINQTTLKTSGKENEDIVSLKKVDYSVHENLVIETAWVENKLVFHSEKFSDLAKKMERWYDIQIRFRDMDKAAYRFTGIFTTETIQQALQAMQVVHAFHFVKVDNIIYID
jgi:transmembrane sensor